METIPNTHTQKRVVPWSLRGCGDLTNITPLGQESMVLYIRQENNIDWRQECVISQVSVTSTLFREKTQEGGATTKAGENGKGLFYQPGPAEGFYLVKGNFISSLLLLACGSGSGFL